MREITTMLSGLLLLVATLTAQAQCDNKITVSYYDNGVPNTTTVNNGQSGTGAVVCPVAGGQYTFSASSTSGAVLTWDRVISRGANSAADVVQQVSTTSGVAGTVLDAVVSFTTSTEFRVRSNANAYTGSNCNKDGYLYMTFNPALTLAASGTSATAGVCAGTSVTLTAGGGSGYTWKANGATIAGQTGATLTVTPATTTTYTVQATTACGQSSQQLTIPVKDVAISPAAPVVCANQSTTLTAGYTGTSATYQWFVKGQPTVLSSANTLTRTVAGTTTYQVVATTAECGTITREATVTVGPQTLRVTTGPTAAICSGGAATLAATSDNPAATYSWSPSTGLNTATGATVTASPTANTTYTVTATTPCGATATSQVAVSIVTPAFAVTPAAATSCAGDAVPMTATSGGLTGTTYKWFRTADLGTVLATTATYTPAPGANTTYRVLTATPCANDSKDVAVTVNAKPATDVTPASATQDARTTTTLTASGGTSYVWTATTGGTTTTLAATSASITVAPAYSTTYAATVTNASGCAATARSFITVARPLPVNLVRFEAAWVAETPALTWTTASEKNSAYFDIERSANGETFEAVGRVAAAGSASTPSNYQYRDLNLRPAAAGRVYYRLHQVDLSGEASYSPVQTLEMGKAAAPFLATAYPNPFDAKVAVQLFAHQEGPAVLTLRNLLGQSLLTHTVPVTPGLQDVALPRAEALPAGVYYLTVRQGAAQQVLRVSHR